MAYFIFTEQDGLSTMLYDRFLVILVVVGLVLVIQSVVDIYWSEEYDAEYGKDSQKSESIGRHDDTKVSKKSITSLKGKITPRKPATTGQYKTQLTAEESNQEINEQKMRFDLLYKNCARLDSRYNGTLSEKMLKARYLYDKGSKILFCDLPKTGSTFLKQVLHIVVGHIKDPNPYHITGELAHKIPFDSFDKTAFPDMVQIVQDYFKFLFVRNPYSRILSGFVDKIFTNNYIYWDIAGKRIVNGHRKNASNKSSECGHDVTFEEFISYVVASEKQNKHRNPHWCPVYESCRPCKMRFDFIGKIEHYHDDMKHLLKHIKKEDKVKITTMDKDNDLEAIHSTVYWAYEVLSKRPHCVSLSQALERAWKVLQIRGVISYRADFPYQLLKKRQNITNEQFINLLKHTIEKNPLDKAAKTVIRKEVLFKAYSLLQKKTLNDFKELFLPDFLYFGYSEKTPKSILGKLTAKWEPFTLKSSEDNSSIHLFN